MTIGSFYVSIIHTNLEGVSTHMNPSKKLQNYSKWFQILNRLLSPMICVGIISTVVIIVSGNAYAYVTDFVITVYVVVWLITFLVESILHSRKRN